MTNAQSEQAEARPARSNLWLRVVSAAVLAPVAVAAAYLGRWPFLVFWTIAGIGVLWEWITITAAATSAIRLTAVGGVGIAAAAVLLLTGYPLPAGAALVAALAAVTVFSSKRDWASAGVVYAAAVALAALVLRLDAEYGLAAIVLLFAVVWSTDIAAYFGGRLMGGPKLWPAVSPKKTWSGALTGTVAAVAAGVLVGWSAGARGLFALGVVCFALSVVSQLGDLFESAIKRRFGVKDSSQLIPGHGGLMDRLDGFVFAAALAAIIGIARGGFDAPSRGLMIW